MINRLQATRYVVEQVTDEPIIASLGNAKFDLFAAGDRPQNFYMWNSMGLASSMGLGLAMARPQQKVIILDGDVSGVNANPQFAIKFGPCRFLNLNSAVNSIQSRPELGHRSITNFLDPLAIVLFYQWFLDVLADTY